MSHLNSSEAKRISTDRLNEIIARGQREAPQVIERVNTEIPRDLIAPMGRVSFAADEVAIRMSLLRDGAPPEIMGLHRNGLSQAMERAKIPASYASHLQEVGPWGSELLAHNLTRGFAHDARKVLIRAVNGEARGILSDRYRRIDSRPILDAFLTASAEVGAIVTEAHAGETRINMKVIIPVLFEPMPNEVIAFGASWSNSDYGHGPMDLRVHFLRLWCLNGAIGTDQMREIHLGKRLSENITYSDETYQYDTKTMVSALIDTIRGTLGPAAIEKTVGLLRSANSTKLEASEVKEILAKSKLTKDEASEIVEVFTSAETEMVPPGQTKWRLSNAISFVAQTKDPGKLIDYQRLAGSLVMPD